MPYIPSRFADMALNLQPELPGVTKGKKTMATRKTTTKKATTTRKSTAKKTTSKAKPKPKTRRKTTAKKKPAAKKAAVKSKPAYETDTSWEGDRYSWKQSMKVYSLTGLDVRGYFDEVGMTKGGASAIIQECIDDPKKARASLQKLDGVIVRKGLPKPLTQEQKLARQLRRLNKKLAAAG